MNILQKAAEILVECKYCDTFEIDKREHLQHNPLINLIIFDSDLDNIRIECNPFVNMLESRKQADTIEDWLRHERATLYFNSADEVGFNPKSNKSHHQWRLDRIKWCLQEMS